MELYDIKINHLDCPVGMEFGNITVSYKIRNAAGRKQAAARISVSLSPDMQPLVFDTGKSSVINSLGTKLPLKLIPRTRYYVCAEVWSDTGEHGTGGITYFETAKLAEKWSAKWIGSPFSKHVMPVFTKEFSAEHAANARLYATGLGMYDVYLDGKKVSGSFFSPGCTNYADRIQYQTYDVTKGLKHSGTHTLEFYLADGWYKGRFGYEGKSEIYGNEYALLAELHMNADDGSETVIVTDDSWRVRKSEILFSSIYDGETFEPDVKENPVYKKAVCISKGFDALIPQTTTPVEIECTRKPAELIRTPAHETVLDFGQNMAGFVRFTVKLPRGKSVRLQYGEILQDGNFYRENLRTAKAEYVYISDGREHTVQPHFTYYGFRYVKIEGITNKDVLMRFEACTIHSTFERTGSIKTSDRRVNRLIANAEWGQRSNFVDVPTDCPQRDERMGWTADTQVFTGTALFQTDCFSFYRKFLGDMRSEQQRRNGDVPLVVPSFGLGGGAAVWGDAATIIPWNMYLFSGDTSILEEQFESMRSWVDFVKRIDDADGGTRLWRKGFQLGDWLALDSETGTGVKGGTEDAFIASAYYYYSACIVAESARITGRDSAAESYTKLKDEIMSAIRREYFTPSGRLAVTTQCAYVLCLQFKLAPDEKSLKRAADRLAEKIRLNDGYLKTGFTGTPFLCRVLSTYGYNNLAYKLLLNDEYPGWLYEVKMGATTIWERWNSVLPDGKISGTDMNSLNHYAYGSIVEWMYRTIAGLNPAESAPGFKKAVIKPMPDYRITKTDMVYDSAAGLYEIHWGLHKDGKFSLSVDVPFDAEAQLTLPGKKDNGSIKLAAGHHEYAYMPEIPLIKSYSIDSPVNDLMDSQKCTALLRHAGINPDAVPVPLRDSSLVQLSAMPFAHLSGKAKTALDKKLRNVK
ncbi:MAG TPA: alfa-L-rhamnosidase RamA [Treponema sp.]|nr:alfa-L-rhamnosidase RamA [Treponema sp.]